MQPTAPYAIIETLEKVHNLHGCTRRISCACTALNECFIANALIDRVQSSFEVPKLMVKGAP
jgi:hypothetical protein